MGIGSFTVAAIAPSLSPQLPLHLQVTATYTLAPGESSGTQFFIEYESVTNESPAAIRAGVGGRWRAPSPARPPRRRS
jgi:hypothetical protein